MTGNKPPRSSRQDTNENSQNSGTATTNDYNAARAYLQRAEVRLSTMHRIAGAFIGGAGLLILIPFFLKDILTNLINYLLLVKNFLKIDLLPKPEVDYAFSWEFFGIFISFFTPVVISVIISFRTIIDLYREILRFYYIPQLLKLDVQGQEESHYLPRFSLTGIRMSKTETELIRDFQTTIDKEHNNLKEQAFVVSQNKNTDDYKDIEHLILESKGVIIGKNLESVEDINRQDIYDASFSLANAIQQLSLAQEVAKMEASLVRHNLFLRRLVFRYIKSVLILLVIGISLVTIASLISYGIRDVEKLNIEKVFLMFITTNGCFVLQFILVYLAVLKPAKWTRELQILLFDYPKEPTEIPEDSKPRSWHDRQMTKFELTVEKYSFLGVFFSLLGIVIYTFSPNPIASLLSLDKSYWLGKWIVIVLFVLIVYFIVILVFALIKSTAKYGTQRLTRNVLMELLNPAFFIPLFVIFILSKGVGVIADFVKYLRSKLPQNS